MLWQKKQVWGQKIGQINRIINYVESNDIFNNTQSGFRKGISTWDKLFILHIIQYLNNNGKELFCAFIDLKQEFDTVWRNGLLE